MKILYVILGTMMQIAYAQATVLPKEQPRETTLYDFSEELINAVENCSEYKTEFSVKETPYAHLADFAGDMPAKSEFEIYNKGKDLCRMRIRFVALGRGETRFNCRLNDQQRELLVQAMRDKSTEEYVITLPTEDERDCSGCSSAITFSGNLFDTTLAMLKPKVCAELHIQPTKDDIEAAHAYNKKFSDKFKEALRNCVPPEDENLLQKMLDGGEIIGMSDDGKCRLKYMNFEIKIDPHEAALLSSGADLQRVLIRDLDKAGYDYESRYDGTGIMFALDACRRNNSYYNNGENIFMRGNIQERNGVNLTRSGNVCKVVLKNTLQIADIYHRDYSLLCNVPVDQINSLTAMYQHLLEESGVQPEADKNGIFYSKEGEYTSESLKADAEIMAKIRDLGHCVAKPPVDPLKIETENFTYSNSLPVK